VTTPSEGGDGYANDYVDDLFGVSPDFYFPMYGLLTKREVKMTGYLPSSVFARLCRFPDRDEIEVHKHAK